MNVDEFKITKELWHDNTFYDIEFTINNLHKFGTTFPVELFKEYLLPLLYRLYQGEKDFDIEFDESIGLVYLKIKEDKLIFYIRSYRMYAGFQFNEVSDMIVYFNNNENVKQGILNFLNEENFINFTPNKRMRLE
jgi:hypothetical protein